VEISDNATQIIQKVILTAKNEFQIPQIITPNDFFPEQCHEFANLTYLSYFKAKFVEISKKHFEEFFLTLPLDDAYQIIKKLQTITENNELKKSECVFRKVEITAN